MCVVKHIIFHEAKAKAIGADKTSLTKLIHISVFICATTQEKWSLGFPTRFDINSVCTVSAILDKSIKGIVLSMQQKQRG